MAHSPAAHTAAALPKGADKMTAGTTWWVIAGALLAAELLTGTFFLLMLAMGAVAAALAAFAGWAPNLQISLAATVGGAAALGWYWRLRGRRAHPGPHAPLGAQPDPDLALDLGQIVTVAQWTTDGSALVNYRGSTWSARLHPQAGLTSPPPAGSYRIAAMQGSVLMLDKV
jgi:membrane protein implicated in regulation of membrane protease activity